MPPHSTIDDKYCFIDLDHQLKELQRDAITEVVVTPPRFHKYPEMGTYGLTLPCLRFSYTIMAMMVPVLEQWAASRNSIVTDPWRMMLDPEAFRLENNAYLVPSRGHTVVLVPLMNVRTAVNLVKNGKPVKEILWNPDKLLLLSDLGIQMSSLGNVRFIYHMYHTHTILSRKQISGCY